MDTFQFNNLDIVADFFSGCASANRRDLLLISTDYREPFLWKLADTYDDAVEDVIIDLGCLIDKH